VSQRDLFYPLEPGWKATDTSEAAAESMKPTAHGLQVICLNVLRVHGPLTADECAGKLYISALAIRPRFTELKRLGKIEDTGTRRRNASGKSTIVWKAKP
jgi:predicted ArsR family transcriptional regulator